MTIFYTLNIKKVSELVSKYMVYVEKDEVYNFKWCSKKKFMKLIKENRNFGKISGILKIY